MYILSLIRFWGIICIWILV